MARLIKVVVHDVRGRGVAGQQVKMYGGSVYRTDASGIVKLLVEDGGDISIYVNGITAYSGSKFRLPDVVNFQKG
jgi:hypothetical protein